MSWRKIGRDSIYVTAATVATQMLQWIILTSIARVEGAKMLGLYALAQAYALPLQYLAWLSIRQRFLTLQNGDAALPSFVFLRLAFPILVFLSAFVVIEVIYPDKSFVWLSGLMFFAKYVEGFYDLIYAVKQKDGNTRLVAKLSIVRTLVSGSLFALLYMATKNIYFSLFGTTIQQILLLFFLERPVNGFAAVRRTSFALDGSPCRRDCAWRWSFCQ